MHPDTAAALQRINLGFYRRRAAEFSATRERPWPAWERVAELCEEGHGGGGRSVLDLGCGNGRLARFLEGRWGARLTYLGLDASEPMLEIAHGRGGGRFQRLDLLREGLASRLPGEPFDLVCAFGLMHHLPGLDNRATLLRAALERLAPEGLLAVSFWQFGAVERFRRRVVPWSVYNGTASEPIDARELEEGDLLLAWGERPATHGRTPPVRYCHWAPPEEVDRLLSSLPVERLDSFRADGKGGDLNLYCLLRRGVE